jgi:hypothetical protein
MLSCIGNQHINVLPDEPDPTDILDKLEECHQLFDPPKFMDISSSSPVSHVADLVPDILWSPVQLPRDYFPVVTVDCVEAAEGTLLVLAPLTAIVLDAQLTFQEPVGAPQRSVRQHTAHNSPQLPTVRKFALVGFG